MLLAIELNKKKIIAPLLIDIHADNGGHRINSVEWHTYYTDFET